MRPNYVYVIQSSDGPCKIGKGDGRVRLLALQSGNHTRLSLIHNISIEGNDPLFVEMLAHKKLRAKRLVGEWFSVSAEEAIAAVDEAFASVVARKQCRRPQINLNCQMPVPLASKLKEIAARKRMSVSEAVELALIALLEKQSATPAN